MYKVSVMVDGKTVDCFDASSLSVVTVHRHDLVTHEFKRDPDPDALDRTVVLPQQQRRLLELYAAGRTIPQVLADMGRARGTCYKLGLRVLEKLHVSSIPAAIIKAKALGLID